MKLHEFKAFHNSFLLNIDQLSKINQIRSKNQLKLDIEDEYNKIKLLLMQIEFSKVNISNIQSNKDDNIPVTILRNHGILTLLDILENKNREHKFTLIPGIGKVYSERIDNSLNEIIKKYNDDFILKIEKKNIYESFLKCTYDYLVITEYKGLISEFNTDLTATKELAFELKKQSDKLKKWYCWFYKKNTEIGKSTIESIKIFDTKELVHNYSEIKRLFFLNDIFFHFSKNSSKYYAVLDSFGIITSDIQSDINEDLVKKIDEYNLDLNNLKGTPRKYQNFAAKFILRQQNVLIGDEMGLGKTIESLIAMNHLNNLNINRFVVICPAGLLTNWQREINKWTNISVHLYHGRNRKPMYNKWNNENGILLTTYDIAKHLTKKPELQFDMLLIDEAHYIKNPNSIRSETAKYLSVIAKFNVFMTGTPLENSIQDMVELIKLLDYELTMHIRRIGYVGLYNNFKEIIEHLYLRRNIKDVLKELPEKIEEEVWVSFKEKEYNIYKDSLMNPHIMNLRQVGWKLGKKSSKMEALKEILNMAKEENKKVVIFSYFRSVIRVVKENVSDNGFVPITGDVKHRDRQKIIDKFEAVNGYSVLIAQIDTLGHGFNLQSASVAIICEPQYKPSTENQAIARLYRMGLVENVLVYRILTKNSVDERLMEILHFKVNEFNKYAKNSSMIDKFNFYENPGLLDIGNIIKNEQDSHLNANELKKIKETSTKNLNLYKKLLSLKYSEIIEKLIETHGKVENDFYNKSSYKLYLDGENKSLSANNSVKSKEGLERHHIFEDRLLNLSDKDYIRREKYDFKFQRKENLVYCNLIEHSILHVVIAKNTNRNYGYPGYITYMKPKICKWYIEESVPEKDSDLYSKSFLTKEDAINLINLFDEYLN